MRRVARTRLSRLLMKPDRRTNKMSTRKGSAYVPLGVFSPLPSPCRIVTTINLLSKPNDEDKDNINGHSRQSRCFSPTSTLR